MAKLLLVVSLVMLCVVSSALGSNITLKPRVVTIEKGGNGSFTIQLQPTVSLNDTAQINLFNDDDSMAAVPSNVSN